MINNDITQPIIHNIARIMQELHFDFSDFSHCLRTDYVNTVYSDCQNLMQTALLCGIDRRTTNAILKGKNNNHKRSILMVIIEELQQYLEQRNALRGSLNANDKDMSMNKYGTQSIKNIVNTKVNGATTTVSVLEALVKLGIIKDIGPKFEFLGYPTPQAKARDKVTLKFSQQLDDLVNDYAYQMQAASRLYHGNSGNNSDNNQEEGT